MTKPEDKAYTMRDAIKEAAEILGAQFGQADQRAAVALATFLYGAHEKELFLKKRPQAENREFL